MVWRADDPQGNEAAKVKYDIVQYTRGHVLDLGCGPSKAFPHFIGVDSGKDTELFGVQMRPDLVVPDCTNLQEHIQDASCDAVFSSHLLEHIEDPAAALASWWRCLKVGGHLVLYLPHADLYPRIGQPGANPDHKHDFTPDDVMKLMVRVGGWDLLVKETRGGGQEYSFLQVYRKRDDLVQSLTYRWPRPTKTACVVRYGGYGDMLQAANILPALKREGYHVTFMTTPKGQDVLAHDPSIDAWFIQDTDQVPNGELSAFWEVQASKFDRFINLSESVEGTLLAYEGRVAHMWPASVRRKRLGTVNYLEFTADLAELPYRSESRFYPTFGEERWARELLSDWRKALAGSLSMVSAYPKRFNIMWVLAGSSVHKMYPHQDVVISNVLAAMPEATVTLVGDPLCEMLEAGWEDNPRVKCMSGKLSIRETLALAQRMDCVVGPETGVLNAVAFESLGKVIMLSHSSAENLTKHWENTATIVPPTACHPCHQLHTHRKWCPEHAPTGASMCAFETDPRAVFEAIGAHLADWRELRRVIEQRVAA